MITFGYRSKTSCTVRALLAIALGVLLLFDAHIGLAIVKIAAGLLIAIGVGQLLVFGSIKAIAGLNTASVFTSALVLILAVVLIFNNFSLHLMRLAAGVCLLVFGVNELLSTPRVNKAITDNYGPVGEDRGVDEQ